MPSSFSMDLVMLLIEGIINNIMIAGTKILIINMLIFTVLMQQMIYFIKEE
jgi:hypothetical protein